jgi:stearoyl-CoA desaturase (Delta-9 desaturase)
MQQNAVHQMTRQRSRRTQSSTLPRAHVTRERTLIALAVLLPLVATATAAALAWGDSLHLRDLALLVVLYLLTGAGTSVGFHRFFTHRSFKTSRPIKIGLGILGSMAIQGPVLDWAATHRRHHEVADLPGDPHTPHIRGDHEDGGAIRGLFYAHVGWMFSAQEGANPYRYIPDLLADDDVRWLHRTFPVWVALGLAVPFLAGMALTGTWAGALSGLLWGGLVRVFLLQHATFSVNSICHSLGARRFKTRDASRNVWWLSVITFGEAWHNNHHAFPSSARFGLLRGEADPGGWLIGLFERIGLVWDVVGVSRHRLSQRRIDQSDG